jgi:hypothetical protein
MVMGWTAALSPGTLRTGPPNHFPRESRAANPRHKEIGRTTSAPPHPERTASAPGPSGAGKRLIRSATICRTHEAGRAA